MITETSVQNLIFLEGINFVLLFFFPTKVEITNTEATSATTPPNFEGIERKTT